MFRVLHTDAFSTWLSRLRDDRAKGRIVARLDALRLGHFGDVERLGGGLSEMRIDVGPGYRLYFVRRQVAIVVLLCGGDKSTQPSDIVRARPWRQTSNRERNMPFKLIEFDPSAYLDSEETIAEYLTAALEHADPDVFLSAVGNVAKARGMASIAHATGLGRESLYKALSPGAKPRYDTILKVLRSLGVRVAVSAQTGTRAEPVEAP